MTTTSTSEEGIPERLHKSAFGRTNLFIEDDNVLVRSVRAANSVGKQADGTVYHKLSCLDERHDDVACWHCCETIHGPRFHLPRVYDTQHHVFHVYGFFCSASCAKAHILDRAAFDRGHQINVFMKMMREVYGHMGPILEAPPRVALKRFGGPFTVANSQRLCRIVEPPFVSYCMLVEEQLANQTMADTIGEFIGSSFDEVDDDVIQAPSESPMYQAFLETVGATTTRPPSSNTRVANGKRRMNEPAPGATTTSTQTLQRFAKAKSSHTDT
tara:strand:+ start:2521 stop:3333 length:813 start_codon:yes stop_codon:yes gene_type:complete